MSWFISVLIVLATVAFMEFFSWWVHKYVMHGWGWGWHRSHHEPHNDALEKNDLFVVVFSGLSILMFWIGANLWTPLFWVATGTTVYGVLYFLAHDGLVHQRWPFRYVPKSGYLKRLYQAHRLHHAVKGKDGCVSFGFVWAPPIGALKEQLKRNRDAMTLQMYESEEEALGSVQADSGRS
jgi:beta-carotene 3-hydroxylase